jgi:colanic acid/amylovoran biosynthesis protein
MAKSETNILYAGNGCYSNRGCEAIVRGTTEIVRKSIPQAQITSSYYLARGCKDYQNETDHGIKHLLLPNPDRFSPIWFENQITKYLFPQYSYYPYFKSLDHELQQTDAVLLLGGDNYSFDYGFPNMQFALNKYVLQNNLPIIIWGASIGPFTKDPIFEEFAKKELLRVTRIYARETETVKYLSSIGIEENLIQVADPAFFLDPIKVELRKEVEELLDHGCIGINLSPIVFRSHENVTGWVTRAREIIEQILQDIDYPILLIPHVSTHSRNIESDDYIFLRQVYESLQNKNGKLFIVDEELSTAEIKWIISKTKAFIGARTHSTIASLSSHVPTITIGYSIKAKGINNDIYGTQDWIIPKDQLTPKSLVKCINSIIYETENVKNVLSNVIPLMRDRAAYAGKDLSNLLGI